MSEFFGFYNFTKPGHGIVDDSHYHPFVRFWMRYGRNFMKLIRANLLYALITLPVYVWLVSQINVITAQQSGQVTSLLGTILLYYAVQMPVPLVIVLLVAAVVLLGPVSAALTYAAIDCAWDRPGLFWSRIWSALKSNWKQALPVGLMDFFGMFATLYYYVDGRAVFGGFGVALQIMWTIIGVIYLMIRVYILPVMVTIKLPFAALVKNCLILSILKPIRPLAVILIAALLGICCSVADIILVPAFMYSFVAYTAAFLTKPVIDEYLIQNTDQ